MSGYKSHHLVSMSFFFPVSFGLFGKIKTANRTELHGWVKKWHEYIWIKHKFLWLLVWVGSVCG